MNVISTGGSTARELGFRIRAVRTTWRVRHIVAQKLKGTWPITGECQEPSMAGLIVAFEFLAMRRHGLDCNAGWIGVGF